jgi:hypothetical protein
MMIFQQTNERMAFIVVNSSIQQELQLFSEGQSRFLGFRATPSFFPRLKPWAFSRQKSHHYEKKRSLTYRILCVYHVIFQISIILKISLDRLIWCSYLFQTKDFCPWFKPFPILV